MSNHDSPFSPPLGQEVVDTKLGAPPIHWSEKIVLALLSVHLVALPWTIGSTNLWSQQLSLALAGITFLAAVLLNPPSTTVIPKIPAWKKLLRSPIIWLGLAVLAYILIQGLNPAYRAVDLGGEYWMVPVDHIEWLPRGMEAPFEKINAFRRLMVFASVFLTIWTIALFLERPKSIRFLLWILALNGVALGIFAFAQLFTGTKEIFWKISSPSGQNFYASFIYRNHAVAYLNLLLAISIGLYFHLRERAWKMNRRSGDKSPIFFFTSTILFTTVLFSGSRGGVIVAVVLLLLAIGYTMIQGWRWNRLRETSVISSIFLGLLILFASVFTAVIGPERIVDRFKLLLEEGGDTASVEARVLASKATADMFRDNWLYGTGAGSFEYGFPKYQQEYPKIHFQEARGRQPRIYMVWEYAHNDWLQYPAEYGVVGTGLLVIGLVGWAVGLVRQRAFREPLAVWIGFGVMLTLLHAFADFVLQNPAVITTMAAAMALALRGITLENFRKRRRSSRDSVTLPQT